MQTVGSLKVLLVTVSFLAACGSQADQMPPLPDAEAWIADHPQPSEGVPVHVIVDFSVDSGFTGEDISVTIDGDLVVQGSGSHRPSEHCNWYGPYVLVLVPGSHTLEATATNSQADRTLALTKTFDLTEESSMIINYLDPTFDSDLQQPQLNWHIHSGSPGCA